MAKKKKRQKVASYTVGFFTTGGSEITEIDVHMESFERLTSALLQTSYPFVQSAWDTERQRFVRAITVREQKKATEKLEQEKQEAELAVAIAASGVAIEGAA